MNDARTAPALREIRAHLAAPAVLAALAGAIVVLAVSGPFGTRESLSAGARAAYWGIVAAASYALGTAIDVAVARRLARRPRWLRLAVAGLAIGTAVTTLVLLVNFLAFGRSTRHAADLALFWAEVTAIAFAVVLVHAAASGGRRDGIAEPAAAPAVLARLPLDRRGELVALSVADHYVEVITTAGRGLVLMRLSDAMNETGGVAGMQVHRSHWVALGKVRAAQRRGDGAVLTLSTGDAIPVSRRHMAKVRAAGLLPAGNGGDA